MVPEPETTGFEEQFGLEPEDSEVIIEDASTVSPPADYEDDEIMEGEETEGEDVEDQDDVDSSEDDVEGEEDDIEYDEVDYPSYIPEDLIPPEEFKSVEEEAQFYRERYDELIEVTENFFTSEEYAAELIDKYQEELLMAHEGAEELLEIKDMLHENPLLAIKKYFPEGVAQLGGQPVISEAEAITMVDKELKQQFGTNYRDKFDQSEVEIEGSLSAKMLEAQRKILEEVESHNNEVKNMKIDIPHEPTPEEIDERLDMLYEEVFEPMGLSEEEYVEFLQMSAEKQQEPIDAYKLVYFDDLIEEAYQMGLEESGKKIRNTVRSMGSKPVVPQIEHENDGQELPVTGTKDMLLDIYRH